MDVINIARRREAREIRETAAELAASRPHPTHMANGDELKFRHDGNSTPDANQVGAPSHLTSYTKGLAHRYETGLIEEPDDFQRFVLGIESGDPRDFEDTPFGPDRTPGGQPLPTPTWRSKKARDANDGAGADIRAWESAGAGLAFDLEGPDAQAVTMVPAPTLGGPELTAEMGEVYAQALLRDVPFATLATSNEGATNAQRAETQGVIDQLNNLAWFDGAVALPDLSEAERGRRRTDLTRATAFRGIAPGDDIGPYVSQFLLAGNRGVNSRDAEREPSEGLITYGAITIDQRVRFAKPRDDHMTTWDEWLDVQNGADLRELEAYRKNSPRRFITTPRDLSTYVHYDALYEAYLNACLFLLASGAPFDRGIPFQRRDDVDHQQGFAHFGGPHILSLVTEVATRALKAVRYQKFNTHRRLRPEALAGRIEKVGILRSSAPELGRLADDLAGAGILGAINARNEALNGKGKGTHLLPMAFCEGSPMHPSYGAGHATVAAACTTVLKAFFDHGQPLDVGADPNGPNPRKAFVPKRNGQDLLSVDVTNADGDDAILTVEGELNKLAANISIGRDWAGVHYFTDYLESIRMGEEIAIGILEEQKLTFQETFTMTVPLFDGGSVRI